MADSRSIEPLAGEVETEDDPPVVEDAEAAANARESNDDWPTDRDRVYRVAAWLVVVGALALAGFLFAVPAHVYDLSLGGRVIPRIRRMDVVELWRVQANNLPEIGRPALLEALFVGCTLVFVVGAAYMIWIAMVDVHPTMRRPVDAAGQASESEPG